MTVPFEGDNPLLKMANNIGLQGKKDAEAEKEWTPSVRRRTPTSTDDLPSIDGLMATFGRAAGGGRGLTGPRGPVVEKPKKGQYGFHPDGTPRDIMELSKEELEKYRKADAERNKSKA